MRTIFDQATREEIIKRIGLLTREHRGLWGKMNVYQMVKHCTTWNDWVLGTHPMVYKQEWLGKIFGKMALKGTVNNDRPMKKGMPAGAFVIKVPDGNFEQEKKTWLAQMEQYGHYSNPAFIHDFFGKMTKEEIGIFVYKHMDHHLRQFNA